MSTVTIEERLLSKQNSRNIIRAKLVELGLAESSAKLEALATIIDGIVNQGAVSVKIREGDTYTIPAGWHNGAGTVSGIAGGGEYTLQPTKTITPTKQQQTVTPDNGFYGMEGVIVLAIPQIYQDVSSVTAAKEEVLAGKVIVLADGSVVAGTMTDNGTVSKILDATTVEYLVPKGYHDGSGKVSVVLETKTITPTKEIQEVTPTDGKVLGKVTVGPIPDKYQDVSNVTAQPAHVLDGDSFVDSSGQVQNGTMPNNGTVNGSVNGITTTSVDVPAGYTSGGVVSFDDTKIVEMLDAI